MGYYYNELKAAYAELADKIQVLPDGSMQVNSVNPETVIGLVNALAGKVDAVVIDNEPAKSYVAANEGLKILETEYAVEDYAACIAKENTALLDAINGALAELKADGTLEQIVGKYISAE